MINRKGKIRKIAAIVALLAILFLGLAFIIGGRGRNADSEAVEAFYGRSVFGGQFTWMDNVKRPGLSASYANASALNFDFDLSDAISRTTINPAESMEFIASITRPSYGIGYGGPFDNEPGLSSLLDIRETRFGPLSFSSSSSSGTSLFAGLPDEQKDEPFDPEDPDDPDNPNDPDNPPVVPVPGSISLALIGLAAILKYRKADKV